MNSVMERRHYSEEFMTVYKDRLGEVYRKKLLWLKFSVYLEPLKLKCS